MGRKAAILLNRWLFVIAGILSLAPPPAFTVEAPQFSVETWTDKNGLPQNEVFAITQTRDGYLWLGTPSGLSRFDGIDFRSYEDKDIPNLNGSRVGRIFEDSQGNLWLGTGSAGVLLVSKGGRISTVLPPKGIVEGHLVAVAEDPAGGVWLSMANGQLYRYVDGVAHLIADHCRNLAIDETGIVWTGSPDGRLLGLGPISKSTSNAIAVSYDPPVRALEYLLASKGGGYWRFADGRVQKCRGDQVQFDLGEYPWRRDIRIASVCEDQDGNLVVGTYGDGAYWMGTNGLTTRLKGLSHSFILSVAADREGALWIGTDGSGLNRVKRNIFEVLVGTSGLTVQSVCEGTQGSLWVGYNGPHVDHWTPGDVQGFFATNFLGGGQLGPTVRSVFLDQNQQLWVGAAREINETRGPTLPSVFVLEGGNFRPVSGIDRDVAAIYQDHDGILWIGTQSGLISWDGKNRKFYGHDDGLSGGGVRAITEDAATNLWIGTERGLTRGTGGKFTIFRKQEDNGLPSDSISSLYGDREGALWVGTTSGLARFRGGRWTRYSTQDGLHSNKIGYMIEDAAGYLWIGSNSGLMRVSLHDLDELAKGVIQRVPCRAFGTGDGLPSNECTGGSQPAACRTGSGKLWFPTILGLAGVNPTLLYPNTNPPPVVIEAVRVDNQLQGSDVLRARPLQRVTIPPGKESLEIDFTCLNLSAPDKSRFRVQLEGHEKTTVERPARERSVHYSNLSPGDYRFKVTACNEDGYWNPTGATLAITVLPAFWQTRTFLSLVVFVLLALTIGLVYYISTQRLQRQLAFLRQQEALEKERARIARDLHDQLGANLTQVALLGEMAESDKDLPGEVEGHARQISQTARETTHALDEIVWTVNPSNDTLDGLINYICKYAQDYLALAGLKYRLEAPSELPNTPITPEFRHNVFLVAKEAVNNVVKHAQATSAVIRLVLQTHELTLEIEDNGKGIGSMNKEAASARNGLRNMRKRMEDVGGSFSVEPGPQGGTLVRLSAPLGRH